MWGSSDQKFQSLVFNIYFKFFINFFNAYLFIFLTFIFERERQSVSGGEAEREGDAESEAGSRLRAVSTEPNTDLRLTDHEIMT